jgi:hypothetical protein
VAQEEPTTEQLEAVQVERARQERRAARESPDPDETAQHERRADKASYLQQKLAARGRSEREA